MSDDERGRRLEPGTPEWDDAARSRRGHPHGAHIRTEDTEKPPREISAYIRNGDRSELASMMDQMRVGGHAPTAEPGIWKHASVLIGAAGIAITIVGAATAVVQSNTRLYDKVENIDDRLRVVEAGRIINIPRLDKQEAENKQQSDRINAIVESLADERRARSADSVETRKAQQDIMALIGRYADRLAEIDKAGPGRPAGARHSAAEAPQRDAQAR